MASISVKVNKPLRTVQTVQNKTLASVETSLGLTPRHNSGDMPLTTPKNNGKH